MELFPKRKNKQVLVPSTSSFYDHSPLSQTQLINPYKNYPSCLRACASHSSLKFSPSTAAPGSHPILISSTRLPKRIQTIIKRDWRTTTTSSIPQADPTSPISPGTPLAPASASSHKLDATTRLKNQNRKNQILIDQHSPQIIILHHLGPSSLQDQDRQRPSSIVAYPPHPDPHLDRCPSIKVSNSPQAPELLYTPPPPRALEQYRPLAKVSNHPDRALSPPLMSLSIPPSGKTTTVTTTTTTTTATTHGSPNHRSCPNPPWAQVASEEDEDAVVYSTLTGAPFTHEPASLSGFGVENERGSGLSAQSDDDHDSSSEPEQYSQSSGPSEDHSDSDRPSPSFEQPAKTMIPRGQDDSGSGSDSCPPQQPPGKRIMVASRRRRNLGHTDRRCKLTRQRGAQNPSDPAPVDLPRPARPAVTSVYHRVHHRLYPILIHEIPGVE